MGFTRKKRKLRPRAITSARLERAAARVRGELRDHGIWTESVQEVQLILVGTGNAYAEYGWLTTGDAGHIVVRTKSKAMRLDARRGSLPSLADILRHEYGHALANIYKGLIKSNKFTSVFGASYDNEVAFDYNPELHVTRYAATNAAEDFAETFMMFLKYDGALPPWHDTQFIRRKWRFIERFCAKIRHGRSTWAA